MKLTVRVLPLCSLALLAAAFAQNDKRVVPVAVSNRLALVIGNSNYKYLAPIPPARNDAADVAAELRRVGFRVTVRNDLGLTELIRTVGAFRSSIRSDDLALVYYSGHGGQLEEENYLLPVDYEPPSPADADLVPRRTYKMSELRDRIEGTKARVRVFVFDACRSSPLLTTKDSAKDYAPVSGKPEGTVIAFASAHLQPAGFAPGNRNSDYTQELLAALRQPRLPDLEALFMQVRARVYERTNKKQTPYLYGFLSGPVYLSGAAPVVATTVPARPAKPEITSLLVQPDADATVTIDDQTGVLVKAGQIRRFNVLPGNHFVRATSGEASLQKTVEVKHGEQQAVPLAVVAVVEEQKLNALVGVWTERQEWDGIPSVVTQRIRVQFRRGTGRNELTATFHEERVNKGSPILDGTPITDPFAQLLLAGSVLADAVFQLRLAGSALTGTSQSAVYEEILGTTERYSGLVFDGTLVDIKHIKFEIVWGKAADGTILNKSGGTLTKQN
jgi:hypothetical protein